MEYPRKSTERKNWNRFENPWKGKIVIGQNMQGKENRFSPENTWKKIWNMSDNPRKGKLDYIRNHLERKILISKK